MPEKKSDLARPAADMARLIDFLAPSSILCVGEPARRVLGDAMTGSKQVPVATLSLEELPQQLDRLPHYELAYVHGALERLPRSTAAMLLARLRDVSAAHLIVHVEIGRGWSAHTSDWEPNEIMAFGLVRAGEYTRDGRRAELYQFSISDYKVTPDWFNSQNWAHPNLWKP